MGVIQENGVTRLTGETSRRFVHMTLHPDGSSVERLNEWLGGTEEQCSSVNLLKGDGSINNLKEVLFQNMLEVCDRFTEMVIFNRMPTKAETEASSQAVILQKVLIEAGLWNEYVDWREKRG